jgi:hypothetical protein
MGSRVGQEMLASTIRTSLQRLRSIVESAP